MSSTAGEVIKCKAAIAWAPFEPLTIEDVEVAPPKSKEVRIKIHASGYCGSDDHVISRAGHTQFPIILGHESAGVVESVGEGVTRFMPGDHVIPVFLPECGNCEKCKDPDSNFCNTYNARNVITHLILDGTHRITCNGKMVYQFFGLGTFSEYTVVSEDNLVKIDKDATLDKVCLFGCGITTGYGAALNSAKVKKGSNVGVWGLGTVGLAAIMGAKDAGAEEIVGIASSAKKHAIAKKLGATQCLSSADCTEKPLIKILSEKFKAGLDFTIECVGHVSTIEQAFHSTNIGCGVTVITGMPPVGEVLHLNPMMFIGGRTLKGSSFGGCKGSRDVPMLVGKYMKGELKIDEFITKTITLNEINEAVKALKEGNSVRTVVVFAKN